MNFGEWIKAKRIAARFGLRQFALLIGEIPSNWCNIENGNRSAPQRDEKLRKIAEVLGFRENSAEWDELFGFVSRPVRLPTPVAEAMEIAYVPTLLRTINEKRLSGEEVQRIIQYVNKYFGKASKE